MLAERVRAQTITFFRSVILGSGGSNLGPNFFFKNLIIGSFLCWYATNTFLSILHLIKILFITEIVPSFDTAQSTFPNYTYIRSVISLHTQTHNVVSLYTSTKGFFFNYFHNRRVKKFSLEHVNKMYIPSKRPDLQ